MQTQHMIDGSKPTDSQKKKKPIYVSDSSSKAKIEIRNLT